VFAATVKDAGLVGEERVAKLLFLALTSRVFDRPVSVAVKAASSSGKSFAVDSVLRFFPPDAYFALTGMSDRLLAYTDEPLQHRYLIIYEAVGMASEFASYLIRSLLSEGRIAYAFVDSTPKGKVTRKVMREGPTGLITTTTAVHLHAENETRILSLSVSESPEQTAAILVATAKEPGKVDVSHWHALQVWLAAGPTDVSIPFGECLATLIPPKAVRLRRDFTTVRTLIKAHALIHRASRAKDEKGRIIATIDDYSVVRELVADLVADAVEAAVKPEVRDTVAAVANLFAAGKEEVSQAELCSALKLDRAPVSRRVAAAINGGYLVNREDRKGRPAKLVPGDPLPQEVEVLPSVKRLEEALRCCAVERKERAPSPAAPDNHDDLEIPSFLKRAVGDGVTEWKL
jgi:hypothetical protein